MSRLDEVEVELVEIPDRYIQPEDGFVVASDLARTLAAEVDAITAKLDDVRMGIGCARGQRTTQYCAEAAQRDEVITKLLAMLKTTHSKARYTDLRIRQLYEQAREIAGRTE